MYTQMIQAATGCTDAEAREAEEIMRHDIFHSTLDWQSRSLFDKAARLAVAVLRDETILARHARAIECGTAVRL
mgnify:CR=1 FL=1